MTRLTVTILGCGGSGGVPAVGAGWGACDPNEPRNARRRPSILIEVDGRRILVDTTPDLRTQLTDLGIAELDAVIYTHAHADHLHGIDDLRAVNIATGRVLPAYCDQPTYGRLAQAFDYVLAPLPDNAAFFRPRLDAYVVSPGETRTIAGLPVTFLDQDHGFLRSLGLRIGKFGYATDVVAMPEATLAGFAGVDTWIVDCLRIRPEHSTHAHLDRALGWIERVAPRQTILTHMNHQCDYHALRAVCPPGVEPGYDGMVLTLDDPMLDRQPEANSAPS